jgi:hypothetical protein
VPAHLAATIDPGRWSAPERHAPKGPRRHGRGPNAAGQSLVEFALILPILLLLTAGVVDLARVFASYIALSDAAREAALFAAEGDGYDRWCAYPPDDVIACPSGSTGHQAADPDNIAYQILHAAPGLAPGEVTLDAPVCDPSPCGPESVVRIGVTYRMPILTPILGMILGGELPMSSATTARVLP